MLVLFENAGGFALFKVLDDGKVSDTNVLQEQFRDESSARKFVQLLGTSRFESTADALSAVTGVVEGKVSKQLKTFLQEQILDNKKLAKEVLMVAEPKLAASIKDKFSLKVVSDNAAVELMRGIRSQVATLLGHDSDEAMRNMTLGLAHSMSRYTLKFSPDKIDTMIVQSIALLDDLDKELNTYCMRLREWYGWHFPEMGNVIADHVQYARVMIKMGTRNLCASTDLTDILEEGVAKSLAEHALVSMGTEISESDVENIRMLAQQVVELSDYRVELFDYLKSRMQAIAPNLTSLVGELVGARLIAHAGSLLNLAKQPASTVQILGAEKALFRALKTRHETPKYGLIYHASLVGQAAPKVKGKIARVLANKAALGIRLDALGDKDAVVIGPEMRNIVENRLRATEGRVSLRGANAVPPPAAAAGAAKGFVSAGTYNAASDNTAAIETPSKKGSKRSSDEVSSTPSAKRVEADDGEKKKEKKKDKADKKDKKDDKKEKKEEKKDKKDDKKEKKDDKKEKKEKKEKSSSSDKKDKSEKKEKKDKKSKA